MVTHGIYYIINSFLLLYLFLKRLKSDSIINPIMIIIVGLGNPGPRYEDTRHNVGFKVVDMLSEKHGIVVGYVKHHAFCGTGRIGGKQVVLAKPQTYMNNSGASVREIVSYYKADPENELIVISDDIDLSIGRIRVRASGSAGGHNGLKSVIQELGTSGFDRVKIGVGSKPEEWELADWVLSRFNPLDMDAVRFSLKRAVNAVECILEKGVDQAMNSFNRAVPIPEKETPKP